MATRAVDKSDSDVSTEVVELEKDERWHARLEDARARREIALREKAAGKPQQARRKPWEAEMAATGTAFAPVEPIIQERDTDRFDFADRVETLRKAAQKQEDELSRQGHNSTRAANADAESAVTNIFTESEDTDEKIIVAPIEVHRPPSADEFDDILTTGSAPSKADGGFVPSDTPEVADLAARYAATLEPEIAPEPEGTVETTSPVQAIIAPRSRRPILLASAALLLAAVPLFTAVPPLEKGPAMPDQPRFVAPPALGVTWSMQRTPLETRSGEWQPRVSRAPVAPVKPVNWQPAEYTTEVVQPVAPTGADAASAFVWAAIPPVLLGEGTRLFEPSLPTGALLPAQVTAIAPPSTEIEQGAAIDTTREKEPAFDTVPSRVLPPQVRPVSKDAVVNEASLQPPAALTGRPLKMTILRPTTGDIKIANTIAADITGRGHEVVRIREVKHNIKDRNLRYYFAEDRREASVLADEFDAELRDFTWFRPRPVSGTAELWLTGRGQIGNPVVAARPGKKALKPAEPMPTARVEPRRSLFQRLFLNHRPAGVSGRSGGESDRRTVTQAPAGNAENDSVADVVSTSDVVATTSTSPEVSGSTASSGGVTSDASTSSTTSSATSGSATTSAGASDAQTDTSASAGTTDSASTGSDSDTADGGSSGADSGSDTGKSNNGKSKGNGRGNGRG